MPPPGPVGRAVRVAVVGAGIAGIACARALSGAGVEVLVVDRGRVAGGRMASRLLHGRYADTGASYFVARDPRFLAVVEDWQRRGLARPWTDAFHAATPAGVGDLRSGPVRWAAAGGLRSLVEDLGRGLVIRQSVEVRQVGVGDGSGPVLSGEGLDGGGWDAVVLAMPDPQGLRLLGPGLDEERTCLSQGVYEPVLSLVAGWPDRLWPGDFDGAFVNDSDVLTWIADDGRRRGDDAAVLVAHSSSGLAARHLDQPEDAGPAMLGELAAVLGVPALKAPSWQHMQRWGLAKPAGTREESFFLGPARVGLCGDGWGQSKVEAAFLSGHLLGTELAARQ